MLSLSLGQRLRQRLTCVISVDDFGILGRQLMAAIEFARSGFDASVMLDDSITGCQMRTGDMFEQKGRRWFLKQDSLPGDLNVKAVAITESSLIFETAPVDPNEANQLAQDKKLSLRWDKAEAFKYGDHRQHACYLHRRQSSLKVDGQTVSVLRSLWTIPCKRGVTNPSVMAAVALADLVFEQGVYEEAPMIADALSTSDESASVSAASPSVSRGPNSMRLELDFQQQLVLEQVALASMSLQTEQRTELRYLMAMQRRLYGMNDEEILAWVTSDPSREGQRRALNVLVFAVAGKIKSAQPDISWKQARAAARAAVFAPSPGSE